MPTPSPGFRAKKFFELAAGVLLATAASWCAVFVRSLLPAGPANLAGAPTVAFIGDSLTAGNISGPPAYPEIAAALLGAQPQNLGVPGITTIAALFSELHKVRKGTRIAVIYLGTNDLIQEPELGAPPYQHALMKASYLFMIWALEREGIAVYTVLLRDISRMPGIGRDPIVARYVVAWTDAWDGWAARQGAIPIDLRCFPDVDEVRNYERDQLHPNVKGNRLLAEHVVQGIKNGGVACPPPQR
jgi:lysophospholipase L1-like esterase